MNDNLAYNGVVTLIQRVNNQVVSKKSYNSGTEHLFEAFMRAICGQSISRFIPNSIDVGKISDDTFESIIKPGVTIPVIATYKGKGMDGGVYESSFGATTDSVPYCRLSVTLFSDMFNSVTDTDILTLRLKSFDDLELATVQVDGLAQAINDTTSGIQMILLWDLYVTNGGKIDEQE